MKNIYSEIDSISPNVGSMAGGTLITIKGKYFYTSDTVPATITIAGQPCNVVSFDMSNQQQTMLVCRTGPAVSVTSDNYGNRGITIIKEYVFFNANSLATAQPSASAQNTTSNAALFQGFTSSPLTVWFEGYIYPRKSSNYEFSLVTNTNAVLLIGASSTNSTVVCVNTNVGSVWLEANTA